VDLASKEKENSTLKRLYKSLKENEKQKANLFDSLKICDIESVRRSIFQEIQKLEEEYTNIKTEISIEESQCIKITIPQVKFFLTQIKKGNINDQKYRQMIINVLIYKIYLYDDSITILFNAQNKPVEKNIPRIEVLERSLLGTDALPS